ncbi:hypothetical protein T261_6694 [Streptomyces lydicus]|nr:hypothetical protein T261_6694 [Streptomyces lydicus]
MTDTGQVPGEGQPENAGGHPGQPQPAAAPSPADAGPTAQPTPQQGIPPQPDAYSYLEGADGAVEDDDLLLMPGAQGAWSEQQAQPMPQPAVPAQSTPMPAPAGDHESGGRDSGAVDLSAVRIPQPAAPQQEPAQAAPARRPLHMGPPVPDPTGGVVRSLADRGPADVPSPAPGRHAGPPAPGRPEAQTEAPAAVPPAAVPSPAEQPLVAAQAEQPVAMPSYGAQPYDGRLTAEQSYGAAGQGPLPGPQLGEIPSQMPPWNDASAQAAAAPVAEAAAPAAPAQEAPQPAEQPQAQPMPMPEQAAPEAVAVVEDGAVAAEAAEEAVQESAPEAVQGGAQAAVEEAVAQAAPAADEPAADMATADVPPAEVPTPVVEAPVEASVEEPQKPVQQPEQAEQAEPVVPVEQVQAAEAAAETAEAVAAVETAQEAPSDAPVEGGPDAAEAEAVAAEPVAVAEADAVGTDPAPQAVEQPEPAEQPEAAPEAEPAAEADAAPVPVAAPQGPVALPAPESSTPPEEPVIEQPEAQSPAAGLPQSAGAEEPPAAEQAAPQVEEAPAGPAAEQQPVPPADDATPEANESAEAAEANETAEAPGTDAPATEPAEPAQPAEPAADEAPQEAEGRPHEQDATELVQLGEDQAPAEDLPQQAEQAEAPDGEAAPGTGPDADTEPQAAAPAYDDSERAAVHRVIRERRDIRNGFRGDPIPNDVLLRVLEAAHTAPSVGHSQPWDFVVIRSDETRERMHQLAMAQRDAYAKSLPKARAKQFRELKIEAILETPVNIVVTADPTRGGRHTLGRHTQPQMAPYSSALAVENLWLAARAEGLGVGWVSFFDERQMVRELGLPEHLEVVAYLCVGYVDEFPDEPELLQAGWSKRRPLSWVVHEETYGRRALPGEDPHDLLQETLQGIRPLDAKALGEAWERQKRMTKPAGALGMLEIISAQLCGLSRKCPPPIPEPAAVAIFAGDHGVHAQGVTPWPQEVTGQMVANFLGGGAVCNAFANQVGAEVCVVDVGVAGDLPATPGLLPRKVRPGTADFTQGPAMTQEDVLKAIEVGIETARDLVAAGNKALLTGEMGIANTTTSAALISVYTGADPAEVTGRGTGINDETHARKVDVVRRALELHQPDPADPIGVLTAVGGLEHAALVGLILGGASLRTPVILDGVSAGAAALVARAIAPEALAACIAGHRSAEPGHVAALTKLGLRPLVDLDLRLGEGTGALLALPVVQSAARAMHEVATFDSAGVTEKS